MLFWTSFVIFALTFSLIHHYLPPFLVWISTALYCTVCNGGGGGIGLCWRPYSAGVLHSVSDQIQNLQNCETTANKNLLQINTCRKVPLQIIFLRWQHFALPSMSPTVSFYVAQSIFGIVLQEVLLQHAAAARPAAPGPGVGGGGRSQGDSYWGPQRQGPDPTRPLQELCCRRAG